MCLQYQNFVFWFGQDCAYVPLLLSLADDLFRCLLTVTGCVLRVNKTASLLVLSCNVRLFAFWVCTFATSEFTSTSQDYPLNFLIFSATTRGHVVKTPCHARLWVTPIAPTIEYHIVATQLQHEDVPRCYACYLRVIPITPRLLSHRFCDCSTWARPDALLAHLRVTQVTPRSQVARLPDNRQHEDLPRCYACYLRVVPTTPGTLATQLLLQLQHEGKSRCNGCAFEGDFGRPETALLGSAGQPQHEDLSRCKAQCSLTYLTTQ